MLKQQTIFCRANTRKSNREISMIVLAQKSIKSCSNRLSYIGSPAEEDDSNPCKASEYTFKGKLKKIELLPYKNQKLHMSQFLHGKTKSILNHQTK